MNRANKQQGIGIIKLIALTPLILIGLVILAFLFTLLNKAYWDYQVRQMCEKDGGVTVYETVELRMDELERADWKNGEIRIMPASTSLAEHDYAYRQIITVIKSFNPRVFERKTEVFRKADGKVLGQKVDFRRSGGDFPTIIGHPTGFGCKELDRPRIDILKKIFVSKGD